MSEFYVWVFVPSAVRDGYQVGAYSRELDLRFEHDSTNYDEDAAVAKLMSSIGEYDRNPSFCSARTIDAPLSAGLRDALIIATAQEPRG